MNQLANRVVMVTGGCGFIGSFLARQLIQTEKVKKVVVVDSLRYGSDQNLADLRETDSVEVVRFTLGRDNPELLEKAFSGVDYLFHLAAEKHNQSKDDPNSVFDANIKGTHTLLDLASRAGVKKAVFSSSLYSYGRMSGPAFTETDLPVPATIYGISKLCGERLFDYHARNSSMKADVLRYFFVYGPRQYAGMGYKSVILKNFERILKGQQPIIFGDGKQSLDYIYVDDVVQATIQAMKAPSSGQILNIGSGTATSVADLTQMMLRVANSELTPIYAEPDWTNGSYRVSNSDLARARLDWTPKVSLEKGLKITLDWIRGNE
jgi:UDP-glucose 4-epimerase